MSQSPLDSTPIDTNTTNAKTSHLDSSPVGTKIPDPKSLTRPTESSKRNVKVNVPEDLYSDPSLSDSSSNKSKSSKDVNSSKLVKKKSD